MTENDEEIIDLTKKKLKLSKDPRKTTEYADICSRLGYLYYQKAYYEKALEEYYEALKKLKNDEINVDIANIHRFIGEALCKIGNDLPRAKSEFDIYHTITVKLNDLVEIQRSHITLGNYYMNLSEDLSKEQRLDNLNKAYSHYLKAYDLLDDIEEKNLVDKREFALMKTRICLNCAFVLDEKKDSIMSSEYLKTAISLAESNNFYEDLIRCLYIKCDHAKRDKNNTNEYLKISDKIVEVTLKTKDYVQQSNDLLYAAETYLSVKNFEKAKSLLKRAYKLRKKCLISSTIKKKLKHVLKAVKLKKQISLLEVNPENSFLKLSKLFEEISDSFCALSIYDYGLSGYKKQLHYANMARVPKEELAPIYSSIAQTYQDLESFDEALDYYQLELDIYEAINNDESICKSLLSIIEVKEKMRVDYLLIKEFYEKAFKKAKSTGKYDLQLKVLNLLRETQEVYHIKDKETQQKIEEIKRLRPSSDLDSEDSNSRASATNEADESTHSSGDSLVISSESEDEETAMPQKVQPKQLSKILKRNVRGETQLHVACIKGNLNAVKKLIEEGHPIHVRDNFNWTPLHEASNYGYVDIVRILLKHGAKYNDQDGPITPLHDASQNGHLLVVEALLNAGATPYVFTDDGYTPLDYLYKFKKENEKNLSEDDLELYQKLFDNMYKQILVKDRFYVIRDRILDNPSLQYDTSNDSPKKSSENKESKSIEKDGETNAVSEYKTAILNLRKKSNSNTFTKNAKSKKTSAVITEDEFKITDDWLVNDQKSSNKRKFNKANDYQSESSYSSSTYEKTSPKSKKRYVDFDKDFESGSQDSIDFDIDATLKAINENTKDLYEKGDQEERSGSPIITLMYPIHRENSNNEIAAAAKQAKPPSENDTFSKKKSFSTVASEQDENLLIDLCEFESDIEKVRDNEAVITSPKLKKQHSHKSVRQLKINKMDTFSLKSKGVDKKKSVIVDDDKDERGSVRSSTSSRVTIIDDGNERSVSWKIKANIESRNFLIPVNNINASIDDLSEQILSRYKALFSHEVGFREPIKVILKNNEGFILFGQDLIKDVLNDFGQVQLVVESWKDAPKAHELYDKNCESKGVVPFKQVQKQLKDSETNRILNLSNMYLNNVHLTVILSTFQTNNEYLQSLAIIDLSSNMLNDEFGTIFFDLFEKLTNLKHLNISNNNITVKTLNHWVSAYSKSDNSNRNHGLETLNLNGNALVTKTSESNILNILSEILLKLKQLKTFEISDCNLDFTSELNSASTSSFFAALQSSSISILNVSHNKMNVQFITSIFESLSIEYKCPMTSIDLANCIKNQNTLETINLSHFNMLEDQLLELTKVLSNCKSLKTLDLSYNTLTSAIICELLSDCSQLESLSLVTDDEIAIGLDANLIDSIQDKLQSTVTFKQFSFKCQTNEDLNYLIKLFTEKIPQNNLKIAFRSAKSVEFYTV